MNQIDLNGHVAIVTGGAQGEGRYDASGVKISARRSVPDERQASS